MRGLSGNWQSYRNTLALLALSLSLNQDIHHLNNIESFQSNEEKFDGEWLLVNAVRQAFGIGNKTPISYAQAVSLAREIAPQLINENSPLVKAFEIDVIKLYRERAEAQSKIGQTPISPVQVLDGEIKQLEKEFQKAELGKREKIEYEINRLKKVRPKLDMSNWTETQAIIRDSDVVANELPISKKGQGYKEYVVTKDRRLRVRVLHPDPPEAHSGVDLIYENYYQQKTDGKKPVLLVRIAALQYKMWNGKNLYTSQAPNLIPQLEKMRKAFCESGFCNKPANNDDERYRLPYCSAFIRPTDKRQTKDAWQVTHAWQIPICEALKKFETTPEGNKVLHSNKVSNCAVTQDIFQDFFNRGMLGSRWVNVGNLNKFYSKIGIFDTLERVVVHAQEY